jgi:hypothetical protein
MKKTSVLLPLLLLLLAVSIRGAAASDPAPGRGATPAGAAARATPAAAAAPQPTAPSDEKLWHSEKGYEVYSWRDRDHGWRFALLAGTNRLKSPDEIFSAGVAQAALLAQLDRLPELEEVSWCPPPNLETSPALEFPPRDVVDAVVQHGHARKLLLSDCDPAAKAH